MSESAVQIIARGPRAIAEAAAVSLDSDPLLEGATYSILEEDEDKGIWRIDAFPNDADDARGIEARLKGHDGLTVKVEKLADADWLAMSLSGLPPVRAGRFFVYGAHDEGIVPNNTVNLKIDAGAAFGTGHHGTTLGCLRALVAELKQRRPARILDVGTGTGILGFAAAKALHTPVVAGDLDPEAVTTARGNARLNGLGPYMRLYTAPGVRHALADRSRRFDVVFANILARPLKRLAPTLTAVVADDGVLILSGLIERDVPGVLSTYRHRGFHLARSGVIEGWATLVLRRGGAAARPR